MIKYKKGVPVEIKWVDISYINGWNSIKNVEPYNCKTIGYVVGYKRGGIVISPTQGEDNHHASFWHIPLGVIKKIRKIK